MTETPVQIRAKCPRCETKFAAQVGPDGFFLCPGCGARLRHRRPPPTGRTSPQITDKLKAAVAAASAERADSQFGEGTVMPSLMGSASGSQPTIPARPVPDRTRPTPVVRTTPSGPSPEETEPNPGSRRSLEELMLALHRTQKRILDVLEQRLPAPDGSADGTAPGSGPPGAAPQAGLRSSALAGAQGSDVTVHPPAPTRARRHKSVLLIDDEAETRAAAEAALAEAEVSVRCATSGRHALELLAAEKPDVIVLEGELGGDISGRDLVDRIRSAMEWVDIPIVLYTRTRLESADDARTNYGADAYVLKGPQGPTALVSQIIAAFRQR